LVGFSIGVRSSLFAIKLSVSAVNKHCLKISQETLLNSVSNDLLSFMVGQIHDSFTLLSAMDVMLFQLFQQAIQVMYTGYSLGAL
jgi:hypothetical protein